MTHSSTSVDEVIDVRSEMKEKVEKLAIENPGMHANQIASSVLEDMISIYENFMMQCTSFDLRRRFVVAKN